MIPHRFTMADELKSNDANMLNKAFMSRERDGSDVKTFCFDRIAKKSGIARYHWNSAKPTAALLDW